MADHFVAKTRLEPGEMVEIDGRPVLERFADLRALLADRAGPEAAALFAEPLVSRGNDQAPPSVTWYADIPGEGVALDTLPAGARARAEAWVEAHLRPLKALADEPGAGRLVRAALSLRGEGDIRMMGDRPVIVNWGLLPPRIAADPVARAAHEAATIGRFLPLAAPLASMAAATPGGASVPPPPGVAGIAPTAAAPMPPPGPDAPQAAVRLSPLAWVPLAVLLGLALAVLVWVLLPGTRLFPAPAPALAITDEDARALAARLNDDLRARAEVLEAALGGAQCRADGTLVLPDGRTPEGLLPPIPGAEGSAPGDRAEASPLAPLAPPADRVVVPDGPPGATAEEMGTATLIDLIEARTVLVLAFSDRSMSNGTGWVVGPGLIVTNHHVIEDAGPGGIHVVNAALGTPQPAQLVVSDGPLEVTGGDFALLRIADTSLPAYALYLPDQSLKLTAVIAAGYPGDVLETDAAFAALQQGAVAVPDLTVTDGVVNTEQDLTPATHVLVHSAPLASGNSGGPLVDLCGRVLGVNTFVRTGPMRTLNFALAAESLVPFLAGAGVVPVTATGACAPVVLRPEAPAATAPDAGTAPAPDASPDAASSAGRSD
jgi:S1-C subfamily serine protease